MKILTPLVCLAISNVFMTFAWYGHLKNMNTKPLWIVVIASWGIAFLEYCFQVPANRFGAQYFSLSQLKIIQEVMTLIVFVLFSTLYMGIRPTWNFLWAGLCIFGAVFFILRDGIKY